MMQIDLSVILKEPISYYQTTHNAASYIFNLLFSSARSTTAANTTSKEHAALQKAKDRQFSGFQRDELVVFLQMIHQVQLRA
jgi:hypothetical protein